MVWLFVVTQHKMRLLVSHCLPPPQLDDPINKSTFKNHLSLHALHSLMGFLLFFFVHSLEKQKCIPAFDEEIQPEFSQSSAILPMERTISTNSELPSPFKLSAQPAHKKQGGGFPCVAAQIFGSRQTISAVRIDPLSLFSAQSGLSHLSRMMFCCLDVLYSATVPKTESNYFSTFAQSNPDYLICQPLYQGWPTRGSFACFMRLLSSYRCASCLCIFT